MNKIVTLQEENQDELKKFSEFYTRRDEGLEEEESSNDNEEQEGAEE